MTNKVTSQFNLNTIESYIKNINIINIEDIMTFHLPQSKSYLKIIGISYMIVKFLLTLVLSNLFSSLYISLMIYILLQNYILSKHC